MSRTPSAPVRVADVTAAHTARGARLQVWLRVALVGFVWATLLLATPDQNTVWCFAVAAAYPLVGAGLWRWLARLPATARADWGWVPLGLDITVLGTITVLAGASAVESWTAYIVVSGFFLLPVLAATQLRPAVALAVAVPTVAVYLFSSITTREANDEPWRSLWLRTAVLVLVCAGSVMLSRIQRSRVGEIGELAVLRARLLRELTAVEDQTRRQLSEALHDGALQYVLTARMDLEDVRDGDGEAVERVDHALTTSAGLLRTTVSELHPAVLEQAGLARAVEDLATGLRRRGLAVEVRSDGMPARAATDADRVVYSAVRELLANVVKHAGARSVLVELSVRDGLLTATVTDDGKGLDESEAARRVAEGHIGLVSHRLRVEASGGRIVASPVEPHGTRMSVVVPD